ncbi:hypothetical protein IPZ64_02390 [Streptomyces violaceoruber]|uniref:hypothetical protein n=1 Tax=Streptomyces violaceoruber TaxID=1935 RepID=UPI001F469040|nr:hypothetical protein [Streptomyces violaceoruber]MCF3165784.1 hypothetical protein [Streptomyces violaceoruber]
MTTDRSPVEGFGHNDATSTPSALARLAGREAHCLTLTTRAQSPLVHVVPEPCTGCGADRPAAEEHARTMPFGHVTVAEAGSGPLGDGVTLTALACERLNASVLIALTHLYEHGGGPLWLRTRSATADDLVRRGAASCDAQLLQGIDAAETWYDRLSAGERTARPEAGRGPHTLPLRLDAFAGPEPPPAGPDGIAAAVRAALAPFVLPHGARRPSSAAADDYGRLCAAALWERLRELNRTAPPGPRVPAPTAYGLLSHPPGPAGGVVPLP